MLASLNERALEIARSFDARTVKVQLAKAPGATDEQALAEFRKSMERRGQLQRFREAPRSRRAAVDVRAFVASLE